MEQYSLTTLTRTTFLEPVSSSSSGGIPLSESCPIAETAQQGIDDRCTLSGKRNRTGTHLRVLSEAHHQLPNHATYHGEIRSETAQSLLRQYRETNCYLTRYSISQNCYVVTVLGDTGIASDIKIEINNVRDKGFRLQGTGLSFHTVSEMLDHFEKHPLGSDLRSLGVPCPKASTEMSQAEEHAGSTGNSDECHEGEECLTNEVQQLRNEIKQLQQALQQSTVRQIEEDRLKKMEDTLNELQEKRRCNIL